MNELSKYPSMLVPAVFDKFVRRLALNSWMWDAGHGYIGTFSSFVRVSFLGFSLVR